MTATTPRLEGNDLKQIFIALTLLTLSCATNHKRSTPSGTPPRLQELLAKRDLYVSYAQHEQDEHGFVEADKCDSLLFSALSGVGGLPVTIEAARDDETGQWFRRPQRGCLPHTISNDMLLGLVWFTFYHQRPDILEQVLRYGKDHGWFMGDGEVFRVWMRPHLRATYAQALVALGGPRFELELAYPHEFNLPRIPWAPVKTGYEGHLEVLHILLYGRIHGYVSDEAKWRLKEHYGRNPRNPLFDYAFNLYHTGDMSGAVDKLLDDVVWPDDRLPTSEDRCEPWVLQRDLGADWEPCPAKRPGKIHSGGDLIFLTRLIADFYGVQ